MRTPSSSSRGFALKISTQKHDRTGKLHPRTTDNSLGDGGNTRRGNISCVEIRLPTDWRNRSTVSSPGGRDRTAQPVLRNTGRPAIAQTG